MLGGPRTQPWLLVVLAASLGLIATYHVMSPQVPSTAADRRLFFMLPAPFTRLLAHTSWHSWGGPGQLASMHPRRHS
eukprot:797210-Rhodomonas_salina.5